MLCHLLPPNSGTLKDAVECVHTVKCEHASVQMQCLVEMKAGSGELAKHRFMLHRNTQHRENKVIFFVCILQDQARFNG